jgi:hypothetical protein
MVAYGYRKLKSLASVVGKYFYRIVSITRSLPKSLPEAESVLVQSKNPPSVAAECSRLQADS